MCVWSQGSGGSRGSGRGCGTGCADMADTICVVYLSHRPCSSNTWARKIATIIPTGSAFYSRAGGSVTSVSAKAVQVVQDPGQVIWFQSCTDTLLVHHLNPGLVERSS